MKKFICTVCGYVYEVKKLLNSVLSVKFQEVNSKNWLKPKVL